MEELCGQEHEIIKTNRFGFSNNDEVAKVLKWTAFLIF